MSREYYKWIPIIGFILVLMTGTNTEDPDLEFGFNNIFEYFGSSFLQIFYFYVLAIMCI